MGRTESAPRRRRKGCFARDFPHFDTHDTMRRIFVPSVTALFLAAAIFLALPAPSTAECAPFCAQIPPEELETAELSRCDTCNLETLEYDDAPCDDEAGCCDDWCEWVPSKVRPLVSRCQDCPAPDGEAADESSGCPSKPDWCGFIPRNVHSLVPGCNIRC